MWSFVRPKIKGLALASLGLVAMLAISLGLERIAGNFHEVVPGVLYRSAQLSPAQFARHGREDGLRSVINLRGPNPGKAWYDDEVREANALGIAHFDFPMKANKVITQDQAARLIALMRDAPKPLLLHCEGGADRTGLAASLYLAAIGLVDEERAESQLSLRYGHLSIPYVSHGYPMFESWEKLETWLGFGRS
jgi:protein tyrosine/serine phosphatase